MPISGFHPFIFSLILHRKQHAGEWRDSVSLPHAQWVQSAAADRQSRFLQHSAAIVQPSSKATQGASHPHQAGMAGTSMAHQHR